MLVVPAAHVAQLTGAGFDAGRLGAHPVLSGSRCRWLDLWCTARRRQPALAQRNDTDSGGDRVHAGRQPDRATPCNRQRTGCRAAGRSPVCGGHRLGAVVCVGGSSLAADETRFAHSAAAAALDVIGDGRGALVLRDGPHDTALVDAPCPTRMTIGHLARRDEALSTNW